MATTYVTDQEVLKAIVRRLGAMPDTTVADSPAWDGLAKEANSDAYDELRARLAGQGYTIAQIDAWDHRARWNRAIALCYAFRAGAVLKAYDLQAITMACKVLEELDDLSLTINGTLIQPEAPTDANIGSGMGPTGIEDLDLDFDLDLV